MSVDQNSGSIISKEEAKMYINAFKAKYPEEVTAFFVGSNNVELILNQANCIGIRIYNGYNDKELKMNQVLVGVDAQQYDMDNGIIIERLYTCPPYCPPGGLID